MRIIVTDKFSIEMLTYWREVSIRFLPISLNEARDYLSDSYSSAISDPDTAKTFEKILGKVVNTNEVAIHDVHSGMMLVLGHIDEKVGTIHWWLVTFTFHRSNK